MTGVGRLEGSIPDINTGLITTHRQSDIKISGTLKPVCVNVCEQLTKVYVVEMNCGVFNSAVCISKLAKSELTIKEFGIQILQTNCLGIFKIQVSPDMRQVDSSSDRDVIY